MIGIKVSKTIGIGDAIQFTPIPENYFKATGEKLVDIEQHWVFDHNPFVLRGSEIRLDIVLDLWDICNKTIIKPRDSVYLSLAEKYCHILNIPVVMKYPRLYFNEGFPFHKRENILLHTQGKSHGKMPSHVIEYILAKYSQSPLYHIGQPGEGDGLDIPKIVTENIWDLVHLISEARMFIGVDSGPAWIACCYPDIVVKKLRIKPTLDILKTWVPLDVNNLHAQWDDHTHQVFNTSENDVGFTSSYKRL